MFPTQVVVGLHAYDDPMTNTEGNTKRNGQLIVPLLLVLIGGLLALYCLSGPRDLYEIVLMAFARIPAVMCIGAGITR